MSNLSDTPGSGERVDAPADPTGGPGEIQFPIQPVTPGQEADPKVDLSLFPGLRTAPPLTQVALDPAGLRQSRLEPEQNHPAGQFDDLGLERQRLSYLQNLVGRGLRETQELATGTQAMTASLRSLEGAFQKLADVDDSTAASAINDDFARIDLGLLTVIAESARMRGMDQTHAGSEESTVLELTRLWVDWRPSLRGSVASRSVAGVYIPDKLPHNRTFNASHTMEQHELPLTGEVTGALGELLRQFENRNVAEKLRILHVMSEYVASAAQETADVARAEGMTWEDVGTSFGLSKSAAWRKFDPTAREKHRQARKKI